MLLVFLSCLTVEGRCGGGIAYQDLARQEVEKEATGTYLCCVLVGNTATTASTGK